MFFHRDGAGPHAGRVVAHGVHGCQVEDDGGSRHKVLWGRVLGLKKRAARTGKVVDRGESGAILEHEDGRRIFVAGDLGVPDDSPHFRDVAGLEDAGRAPKKRRVSDLEEFARAGSDLAKSHRGGAAALGHECEGPALCLVCRRRREAVSDSLAKAEPTPAMLALELLARRLQGKREPLLKSVGAGSAPLPVVFRPLD